MTHAARVDPVLVEIIRNGVIAVTEEMKINLMRTAYNMIIYEALDFTVGLFTVDGETVSIGLGLPMFIRGMSETVKAVVRNEGLADMREGDIYITNDAYVTGSHLNHVTLVMPVFYEAVVVGFTACMAHWIDIGGTIGGVTTDIYSEGLQLPILAYKRAGRVNDDLLKIIAMNVRLPSLALGDLRAQTTAVTTGTRRFLQLVHRFGRQKVADAISEIMRTTDAAARAGAARIPDGIYEAQSFMDDDGITIGKPVPIKVRVVVENGGVTIDLTEVSRQVRGFYNSGYATGIACAQVAYKCLTTPNDMPINDGSFRSLKVIMPSGSVVSATRPAPMRWWMTFPMTVVDTIFKALATAVPDLVIAGHHADLLVATINGINPATGRFFIGVIGPTGGGWGAKKREDGVSVTVCINDGDTHNSPSEHLEMKYPILIERYELRTDSGGPGEHRGGLGADLLFTTLAPVTVETTIERTRDAPWGLEGGMAAKPNRVAIRRGGTWSEQPNGKINARLEAGDACLLASGGGGGFGDPRRRDRIAIRDDVEEGYVSAAAAAAHYGFEGS